MERTRFEIKPDYYFRKSIRVLSLLTAIGIIAFGLIKPNYHILILSIFFFIIPVFASYRYLKIFNDCIVIENISIFPFFNSINKINLDEIEELSYNGKESRVIKAFFAGGAKYHQPEDVQPVINEHIIFKYKNGKDFKLFKIGNSEEFKKAFDSIISGSESLSIKTQQSKKEELENDEHNELPDTEVTSTESKNKVLEIIPEYKTQRVIKFILFGIGILLGILSLLFSSLTDMLFLVVIFLLAGGFYTFFSSKRHVTVYDDRIVFEDISVLKTFSETTTVLFSQVQDISYLKKQFLIFGERVPIASANDQTMYNENRVVFKLNNKKEKVIKQTGDKNEFYNAYLKIKSLIGKTNHTRS